MKVLYIGGYSRSGSTLLLRLLGEHPAVVAVGELFDVWERSYSQNQLCGCGSQFRDCDFWTQVTKETFGCEPDEVPVSQLNQARSRVQGYSRIPVLWHPRLRSAGYRKDLRDYVDVLADLYTAVQKVTGSQIIVDSSKVPQYAWVLAEAEEIELHMVHLVRDSRAVAFSWRRHRVRPEITQKRTLMDRHSMVRSAAEWNIFNHLLRSRRNTYASYSVIKYEDLVTDPYAELQKVLSVLGLDSVHLGINPSSCVGLGVSHTASGNPDRFKVGTIGISLDAEWTRAMRRSRQALMTALTVPDLVRYGYPLLTRGLRGKISPDRTRLPSRQAPR